MTAVHTGYEMTASCPRCGGLLRHLTGATTLLGTESTAVARCQPCRREFQIVVRLLPVGNAAKTAYQRMNRARHREEATA
jgi:transcription elongation factor Elf1